MSATRLCKFILKSKANYWDCMQDFIDVQYVINFCERLFKTLV
jgi:hypothetical protein